MKREVAILDATPSKRLFLSIIADYDLNRAICELVDNGIDVWTRAGRKGRVSISILLDVSQQTITVQDNAGGLPRSDLKFIVSPGQTGTNPTDETIGLFGVGTKRAVVALAQDVRMRTRFRNQETFQLDFDDQWIQDDNWELPIYQVDEIAKGTTIIQLQRLRSHLSDESIKQLADHLGATYARFVSGGSLELTLNGQLVAPQFFENWAYPPGHVPQEFVFQIKTDDGQVIRMRVIAGLTLESSPASGEYGVYFYCNDRLIARALKTAEVGFVKGLAGLPHPKLSLTRVLVFMNGDARSMPWNSSKSDINGKHPVFSAMRDWLTGTLKYYTSLSRIWMGDWPEKVFRYKTGQIKRVEAESLEAITRSHLPPLPKSRPRLGDILAQKNRNVAQAKPWTKGLYEGVIAADLISKQRLEQRNRLSLIVLDSTLEIAFKEYLVNDSGASYTDSRLLSLFGNRGDVHKEIEKYIHSIGSDIWKKINYYYRLRCKLIHERTSVAVDDHELRASR